MSLTLSKVLINPDSTIVGSGNDAIVLTRHQTEKSIQEKMQINNPLARPGRNELSPAEKKVLDEMQARDREVRQHEQKHLQAAGSLAKGPARYIYQIGPDGKPYATGGSVRIDTSISGVNEYDNQGKATQIQNAALAPGDPSIADMGVANNASQNSVQKTASREYRKNAINPDGLYNQAETYPETINTNYSLVIYA